MNEYQKKKARILIVDDTQGNIQILGTILLKEGYQVNVARNGVQAIDLVEKVVPDLILLDIMMPEMDGFETCRRLKSSPGTKNIPIVFLTARTETDDIVKGFELGAVDYITKPFNATELLVRVNTHLDLKFSKDIIEHVSNERKELLHVLCHDLSNTFHSLICLIRLLESYKNFEELKAHLYSAAKNGVEIIQLVRDMRALEDHKIEVYDIPLRESIEKSHFLLSDRFSAKNIALKIQGGENIMVRAEKTSFVNSVLNNIFTNALKFSYRDSEILVDISTKEGYALISVRDFGIGIPEKILNNLFDLSKATSRPGTEGETGTGFGMPLIRKFVSAYGGEISISSRSQKEYPADHGTEVHLRLPVSDAPANMPHSE
ncbi:MAG: hybrid sensor histidine kinase/response regulator [Desulfococcaceae bacterium]|jgi:DNA-binding response OmpR family regulator|nr:hybrid sensor histidine kinase/response regulator [Desulfococcaceae bacterium]